MSGRRVDKMKLPELLAYTQKWNLKILLITGVWLTVVGFLILFLFQRTDIDDLTTSDLSSLSFYSAAFHVLATGFAVMSWTIALAVLLPNLFLVGPRLDRVQRVLGRHPDDIPDSVYVQFLLDDRDDPSDEEKEIAHALVRGARMSYQRAVLFYLSISVLLSFLVTPFGGYLYFLRLRNEVWGTPVAILLYQHVMERVYTQTN